MFPGYKYAGLNCRFQTVHLNAPNVDRVGEAFALLTNPFLMRNFMSGWEPSLPEYTDLLRREEGNPTLLSWWIHVEDRFAGIIGIRGIGSNPRLGGMVSGKLFYVVAEPFQRQGVLRAAARAAMDYAFWQHAGRVGLPVLEVTVLERHTVGIQVAQALGFTERPWCEPEGFLEKEVKLPVYHAFKSRPQSPIPSR